MVGWVEFVEAGVTCRVILDAETGWSSESAAGIAEVLNRDCLPGGDPADDAWGHEALIKVALRLGGIAWLGPGRSLG